MRSTLFGIGSSQSRKADEARAEAARVNEARAVRAARDAERDAERARRDLNQARASASRSVDTQPRAIAQHTSGDQCGTPTEATCPVPQGKAIAEEATMYVECINRAITQKGDGWSMSLTTEVVQAAAYVGVESVREIILVEPCESCKAAMRSNLKDFERLLDTSKFNSIKLGNVGYDIARITGCENVPRWMQ